MKKPELFEVVEVGNWYTEYRCRQCGQNVVVSDDCDHPCDPGHYHECGK